MSKVLDRIQKLLALADSPNENEARNAAFLAAKLIRKHGIVLHEPGAVLDPFQDLFGGLRVNVEQPPRRRQSRGTKRKDFMGQDWLRYASNEFVDTFCSYCGKPVLIGTPVTRAIHWTPTNQEAAYHDDCWVKSYGSKPEHPKPKPDLTDDELHEIFGDVKR